MKDQNQNWTKTSLVRSQNFLVAKEQQQYLKRSFLSPAYMDKRLEFANCRITLYQPNAIITYSVGVRHCGQISR